MPVDIKYLERLGISAKAYKSIFTQPRADWPKRTRTLIDTVAARIKDGYTQSLTDWKMYYAVDLAYDTPFNQTTATFVQHILGKHLDAKQTLDELSKWGLSEDTLFLTVKAPGGNGTMKVLNVPVFYQIFIPIVKAYTTVRLAKIFNERNSDPLLEYKPIKEIEHDQVLCEVMTDIASTIGRWYGYPAVLRQAIQNMLKYGISITFPREEWSKEHHIFDDANGPKRKKIKEGIRLMSPHPSQMYYDIKSPLTTLNTDSGIEFLGHWRVGSYGEILDNPNYWNRKNIFCGTNWFLSPLAGNFFQEVFPCSMKFPVNVHQPQTRDDKAAWYNTTADRDKSIFLTEHYQKIIPKDWGLGQYKYPVWHRFTMAGDDTPVYVAPVGYTPGWFMGCDYDENSGRTVGFAGECIPWQDQLGNILSQMMLVAKQNLTNVIFYDTNLVNVEDIEKMKNVGESRYRATQYIGFDSMKVVRGMGMNQQNAFMPVQLTKMNMQELAQLVPMTLGIMERVLQISAQEAGTQGTHQQSKFELQQVGGASTNRVMFTCSYVDEGIDAWKQQILDATQAYADPEWLVNISEDIPQVDKVLEELGFDIKHRGKQKLAVKVDLSNFRMGLESFAKSGEGIDKQPDKETAQIIFSCISVIAGQEDLKKEIGARNLLTMIELGAKLGGAPRGFRLPRVKEGDQNKQVEPNVIAAIQQAQQATLKAVQEKIGQPAAQEIGKVQQEVQQLQGVVQQLEKIYAVAQKENERAQQEMQQAQQEAQLQAAKVQQDMQLKDAAAQKEQQRKDAISQAEERRKQAEFEQEQRRKEEAHRLELEQEKAKTEAQIAAEKKKAAQKPKPAAA